MIDDLARDFARWARPVAAVALLAALVTGCTSTNHPSSAGPTTAVATAPATAPIAVLPTIPDVAATTSSATTSVPPTASATGGDLIGLTGAILPDRARTPGATNPAVTQANLNQTICVSGWTTTVRPPSSYTTRLKEQQLASGYAYHGDTNPSDYEEDHLVSLEIGGSPTSALNLWPEPYNAPDGARSKDVIENKLHDLVCAGTLSLATAQHAIASNWWTAYHTYVGTPTSGTPTTAKAAPAPTQAPGTPPGGATALCNDGTYSYAAHHQGACSHHGGVKVFYK